MAEFGDDAEAVMLEPYDRPHEEADVGVPVRNAQPHHNTRNTHVRLYSVLCTPGSRQRGQAYT